MVRYPPNEGVRSPDPAALNAQSDDEQQSLQLPVLLKLAAAAAARLLCCYYYLFPAAHQWQSQFSDHWPPASFLAFFEPVVAVTILLPSCSAPYNAQPLYSLLS
eukprot:6213024-Pleurochrysis_carterae.AAC.7